MRICMSRPDGWIAGVSLRMLHRRSTPNARCPQRRGHVLGEGQGTGAGFLLFDGFIPIMLETVGTRGHLMKRF
jgi:hypothetical protein